LYRKYAFIRKKVDVNEHEKLSKFTKILVKVKEEQFMNVGIPVTILNKTIRTLQIKIKKLEIFKHSEYKVRIKNFTCHSQVLIYFFM
jgi:hypothetical protein